jgi:phosphoribosylanthranilate isomerase
VKKVGVFVDETPEKVLEIYRNWKLDVVQLHYSMHYQPSTIH